MLEEFWRYWDLIVKKSGESEEDLYELLALLFADIHLVPGDELRKTEKKAEIIVRDIDPDDELFIACALLFPNSILWSDDRKLKQQKEVPIMSTKEFIEHSEMFDKEFMESYRKAKEQINNRDFTDWDEL